MTTRTRVAMTFEEVSPGVPYWGPNTVTTDLLPDQTEIAIENLVSGRTYYIKTWNESEFGVKSQEIVSVVKTPLPTRTLPLNFSANGVFDQGSPMYAYVKVPTGVIRVEEALVTVSFRQFFASATAAASGGGSTSGASSTSSSSSDLTGLTFVQSDAIINAGVSGPASAGTAHTHGPGGYATEPVLVSQSGTGNHSHTISHTHSTPNHTHGLTYGTFEETYPTSHEVFINLRHREDGVWVLRHTFSPLTKDLEDIDMSDWITGPGDWRLSIASAGGTPNNGRLAADVFGSLVVVFEGE